VSQWAFWVLISSYLSLASHRQYIIWVDLPRRNNVDSKALSDVWACSDAWPVSCQPGVRRAAGYASRRPEELEVRRPLQHAQEMRCLVKGVEVLG
jgi:hypothetical protein